MQRLILVSAALIILAWMSGCSAPPTDHPISASPPATRPVAPETPMISTPDLTGKIGDILANPNRYSNLIVEIVGYYRGWDLMKEVKGTPPVTRSDWVIADESGAIYVTGLSPAGLDPASQKDAWTRIRLVAAVENRQGTIYLKAHSIKVLAGP